MYVKIEHENSTAGCVQSVIIFKCSRKGRIIGTNILKNTPVSNWTASSLLFFRGFFFKLKPLPWYKYTSFSRIFFRKGGGGFLSLSKSCQVLCPFHSIVEIESGHKICSLQLRCSLLAQLQLVVSSV